MITYLCPECEITSISESFITHHLTSEHGYNEQIAAEATIPLPDVNLPLETLIKLQKVDNQLLYRAFVKKLAISPSNIVLNMLLNNSQSGE